MYHPYNKANLNFIYKIRSLLLLLISYQKLSFSNIIIVYAAVIISIHSFKRINIFENL